MTAYSAAVQEAFARLQAAGRYRTWTANQLRDLASQCAREGWIPRADWAEDISPELYETICQLVPAFRVKVA